MNWNDAQHELVEGLARICGIYGMNPLVGRLWALLFLSPRPLALEELAEGAGAAKSTASVAIRKLVDWRVARRVFRRGDRRDFYEPVTDGRDLLDGLVTRFVGPELAVWDEVGAVLDTASAPSEAEKAEILRRLASIQALATALMRGLEVARADLEER